MVNIQFPIKKCEINYIFYLEGQCLKTFLILKKYGLVSLLGLKFFTASIQKILMGLRNIPQIGK